MSKLQFNCVLVLAVVFGLKQFSYAVDIVSSDAGGPTAETLATMVADVANGVSIVPGTASFTINAAGNPSSNLQSIGSFTNGITPQGTLLPSDNQNIAVDAKYEAGVGIDSGVCLCTGLVSDSEASSPVVGRGVGLEGPNNGIGGVNAGEIGATLGTPVDLDFFNETGLPGVGDATVLEFDVDITSPGYLRLSLVFGSDEFPFYINQEFNDSFAIFIDGENIATITKNSIVLPFSLQDVAVCEELFRKNDVAPAPPLLVVSGHASPGEPLYDVELGGFTATLTRETSCVLAPGTYTVKIVVQDVSDTNVDAGLFVEENSLKLFSFAECDLNLDGIVDGLDLGILLGNWGDTDAEYLGGELNGITPVDGLDLGILLGHWDETGNIHFCADFNRDGLVDGLDAGIWQSNGGLDQCASRFEGDADGDGDVDADDGTILQTEFSGTPSGLCGCESTQQAQAAGGTESFSSLATASINPPQVDSIEFSIPTPWPGHPLDVDADGDIDTEDINQWKAQRGVAE